MPIDPSVPPAPPPDDACAFWIERGKTTTGLVAVEPRARWLGYQARSRRALQRWTIDRIRRDRPRYRIGVELGCGTGEWTELLAPWCDELHASDISPDFVAQTRARTAWHRACHVDVRDLRVAPIPAGTDLVYIGAALMYLPDRDVRALLQRLREAIAPGAHVIIRDWCAFNLGRRTTYTSHGLSIHRRAGELRTLAEAVGLRCLEARASFSIFGELISGGIPALAWPLRGLLRVATIPWTRASHTLRFRA